MMNYIKTLSGIVICLMVQQVYSQQLLTRKEAIEITLELLAQQEVLKLDPRIYPSYR